MNWLLILVVLILAGNVVWGFCKGFLRVLYSMIAWIVILVFVTWATPYVADFLADKTNIDTWIEEKCSDKLHEYVMGEKADSTEYSDLQMKLPESITNKLFDTNQVADRFLEESGAYQAVAGRATEMAMRVISFVVVLLIALISFHLLSVLLKLVEKLPLIGGINRTLGIFAGFAKGILIVWLAFAIIAMGSATELGMGLVSFIYESPLLVWIYENNFVLTLLMAFL